MYNEKIVHVNGHEYKDIFKNNSWVGTEVLTPNCGWKPENTYCSEMCSECIIAEQIKEMIGVK